MLVIMKFPCSSSVYLLMVVCLTVTVLQTAVMGSAENRDMHMKMWMSMKDVKSTSDFIYTMVKPPQRPAGGAQSEWNSDQSKIFIPTQTGSVINPEGVERMSGMIATADVCEPRMSTVAIPPSADSSIVYWPPCTKIRRCGGCCGSDLLECTPTSVNITKVLVMQLQAPNYASSDTRMDFQSNLNIDLVEHLACICSCRTKASDCDPRTQVYDEESCSCRCTDVGQATSCPLPKRWDGRLCRCICPNLVNCLEDEYFNFSNCSCTRGTPMVNSSSSHLEQPSQSSCVPPTPCRFGNIPVLVGNTCTCRRARRSARLNARP